MIHWDFNVLSYCTSEGQLSNGQGERKKWGWLGNQQLVWERKKVLKLPHYSLWDQYITIHHQQDTLYIIIEKIWLEFVAISENSSENCVRYIISDISVYHNCVIWYLIIVSDNIMCHNYTLYQPFSNCGSMVHHWSKPSFLEGRKGSYKLTRQIMLCASRVKQLLERCTTTQSPL